MSDKWENFIFFIDLPGCLIDWSPQSALDLATIMSWQWACDCFVLRFRVRTCRNFWFFITENTKYTQFQANKFCQWTRHQCPNKGTKVTTTLLNDVKQQIEQSWSWTLQCILGWVESSCFHRCCKLTQNCYLQCVIWMGLLDPCFL